MISYSSDQATLSKLGETLSTSYAENKPWPHVVIDDFIAPDCLERVREEALAVDQARRYAKVLDRKTDHNKFAFTPDVVGPETSRPVIFMNYGPFINLFVKMTGIGGL